MDRFKRKCNKQTIEVKENIKRKMKDPKKFCQEKKTRQSKRQ